MEPHKSDGSTGGKMVDDHAAEAADRFDDPTEGDDELVAAAATVVVVGAGVIIFEAALLPGFVLGIATIDPPPLKWSDLRYVFDIKEDSNGKEAIQA